jgi:hypothetical protein
MGIHTILGTHAEEVANDCVLTKEPSASYKSSQQQHALSDRGLPIAEVLEERPGKQPNQPGSQTTHAIREIVTRSRWYVPYKNDLHPAIPKSGQLHIQPIELQVPWIVLCVQPATLDGLCGDERHSLASEKWKGKYVLFASYQYIVLSEMAAK